MRIEDFVKKYKKNAVGVAERYGLPAAVVLTQGGLESAWGAAAYGNNFFGIKANAAWNGQTQLLGTSEFVGGKYVRVKRAFRKYSTPEESFVDYCKFIVGNRRYNTAVARYKQSGDSEQYCRDIAAAGYATAPDYADKLIRTLQSVRKYMT